MTKMFKYFPLFGGAGGRGGRTMSLYVNTHLVKGHFLMLHRLSGTLFLTKSGHPTPSHPSNHHLKPIFFSSPTDCVCVWEGRIEGGGERELAVCSKVWEFKKKVSCNGPFASKENWHRKEHIIVIIIIIIICKMFSTSCTRVFMCQK